MRNSDHQFPLGLHYNFGTDNPWGSQYQHQITFPPVSGDLDLMDGTDFLLLDGGSFLLL